MRPTTAAVACVWDPQGSVKAKCLERCFLADASTPLAVFRKASTDSDDFSPYKAMERFMFARRVCFGSLTTARTLAFFACTITATVACDEKKDFSPQEDSCDDVRCNPNATCDPETLQCVCDPGFTFHNTQCIVPECESDSDCDDTLVCNGVERCDGVTKTCTTGVPLQCGAHEQCNEDSEACVCETGFVNLGEGCEAISCANDSDCDDNNLCNGMETCDIGSNRCISGTPITCTEFNEICEAATGACGCPEGFADIDGICTRLACQTDDECSDGITCNGIERCNLADNRCERGSSVSCTGNQVQCVEPSGACTGCKPGYIPTITEGVTTCAPITCGSDADCDDGNACNGRERCVNNVCAAASPANIPEGSAAAAQCTPTDTSNGYTYFCAAGYRANDEGFCVAIASCASNADCDDGIFCNGAEVCGSNGKCVTTGNAFTGAVVCGSDLEVCSEDAEACVCTPGTTRVNGECVRDLCYGLDPEDCVQNDTSCPVPQVQVLTSIRKEAVLQFSAPTGYAIEIAELGATQSLSDATWYSGDRIDLTTVRFNPLRVIARTSGNDCELVNEFDWTYTIVDEYAQIPVVSNALNPRSNALPAYLPAANGAVSESRPLNPLFKGWATGFVDVIYGLAVDYTWRKPWQAMGPARGTMGINVLGNHGRVTMTFDPPITDGPGADFAVFENGFISGALVFAELAYIEVSSDGVHFIRFDTHALQPGNPGAYGSLSPALFNNLAGTQPAFWGTPFDLRELMYREEVLYGLVDLSRITHVRVIDIVGDASAVDSFGNFIFDATPTWGSGGFDFDAIGVIHQAQ